MNKATAVADEKPLEMFKIIRYPSLLLAIVFSLGFTLAGVSSDTGITIMAAEKANTAAVPLTSNKFSEWALCNAGISEEAFGYAMKGYEYLHSNNRLANESVITIVDFSKPSTQKRLYVIDMKSGNIIFNTLVAHGRNSGHVYAADFSNKASSLESSPGFYVTGGTYNGKNGYSLRLAGCEKGFNDNAMNRGIVLHGADYVSETFIQQNGFLGRSHGCPAVPAPLSKKIIDNIKNGSCLFVYFPSKKYLQQSALLKS